MKIIDSIETFINSFKKKPPQFHRVINDPVGTVVAKVFFCDDLNRSMYEDDAFPGLCPYCHNTIKKIPNLEFVTSTKKDIVCTYDGFYIVSEKFKGFCDEQGFNDLSFIPLKKSPGHYYFEPQTIFPIDDANTIFEHEGEPCPKCGNYRWFGGPHRIFSKHRLTEEANFIQRTKEFHGDKCRKFFLIIVGLKTEKLMKEHGFFADSTNEVHYLEKLR